MAGLCEGHAPCPLTLGGVFSPASRHSLACMYRSELCHGLEGTLRGFLAVLQPGRGLGRPRGALRVFPIAALGFPMPTVLTTVLSYILAPCAAAEGTAPGRKADPTPVTPCWPEGKVPPAVSTGGQSRDGRVHPTDRAADALRSGPARTGPSSLWALPPIPGHSAGACCWGRLSWQAPCPCWGVPAKLGPALRGGGSF